MGHAVLAVPAGSDYTTFTNLSMKYLVMCKVYTDVEGIK